MITWPPAKRSTWVCLLALAATGAIGCGVFWDETPAPPTDQQKAAMQRSQSVAQRRQEKIRREIEQVRDRSSDGPRPPDDLQRYADWTLAETIVDSLVRMRESAVPELVEALQDPRAEVRQQAAQVLARIGPEASEAVPELIGRLDDADPVMRRTAIRALGQIGPAAAAAVPRLLELLKSEVEDSTSESAAE